MATKTDTRADGRAYGGKGYPDFQDHLKSLGDAGLLHVVDEPVNKDTEMHPLVRWQFRGGIKEADRKALAGCPLAESLADG